MYDWLRRLISAPAAEPVPRNPAAVVPATATPTATTTTTTTTAATATRGPDELGISWLARSALAADFNCWIFETDAGTGPFVSPLEQKVLDAIDAIVQSRQSGANLVRRMPGVIPQLLQSLRSDDFSGVELARKISNDVVLVAEVVRLANSAFYSTDQTITSVEHAVLVLGQNGLRQLISGVAFKPIIGPNAGHFTRQIAPRLWQQAEQCALANRLLANHAQVDPFEAFLAGLIQNVGLIAALRVIEQSVQDDGALGSESFCNVLIDQARKLSCSIAREWQFPETIITAIEQQASTYKTAQMSPLARVLSDGDFLSKAQLLEANGLLDNATLDGLSAGGAECLRTLKLAAPGGIVKLSEPLPE